MNQERKLLLMFTYRIIAREESLYFKKNGMLGPYNDVIGIQNHIFHNLFNKYLIEDSKAYSGSTLKVNYCENDNYSDITMSLKSMYFMDICYKTNFQKLFYNQNYIPISWDRNSIYEESKLWFIKDYNRSLGDNIIVTSEPNNYNLQNCVVQESIDMNLIDNRRWDMRIYVFHRIVNNKFETWLYNDGLVRLCPDEYDENNLTERNMLSNTSKYIQEDDINLLTRKISDLNDYNKIFELIKINMRKIHKVLSKQIFSKSLYKCENHLMGYDCILDKNNKIYVIEVNHRVNMRNKKKNSIKITEMKDNILKEIYQRFIRGVFIDMTSDKNLSFICIEKTHINIYSNLKEIKDKESVFIFKDIDYESCKQITDYISKGCQLYYNSNYGNGYYSLDYNNEEYRFYQNIVDRKEELFRYRIINEDELMCVRESIGLNNLTNRLGHSKVYFNKLYQFLKNEQFFIKGKSDTQISECNDFSDITHVLTSYPTYMISNKKFLEEIFSNKMYIPKKWSISQTSNYKDWFIKPILGSKGDGVIITNNPLLENTDNCIIQESIKTSLIDKRKWDLRIYVVHRIINNKFQTWLYTDGLVRLCPEEYNKNCKTIRNMITSTDQYQDNDDPNKLTKCLEDLDKYNIYLPEIIKKLSDIHKELVKYIYTNSEFKCENHLMGYDVIIDQYNKLYLLEINLRPDLSTINKGLVKVNKQKIITNMMENYFVKFIKSVFIDKIFMVKDNFKLISSTDINIINNLYRIRDKYGIYCIPGLNYDSCKKITGYLKEYIYELKYNSNYNSSKGGYYEIKKDNITQELFKLNVSDSQ